MCTEFGIEGPDDERTLFEVHYEAGDFLDVAILPYINNNYAVDEANWSGNNLPLRR